MIFSRKSISKYLSRYKLNFKKRWKEVADLSGAELRLSCIEQGTLLLLLLFVFFGIDCGSSLRRVDGS